MQQLAIAPQTLALLSISACAEKSHNPSAALPPGYASRGAEGVDLLFHPAHVPPQSPPIPAHAAPTCIFIPHPTAPPAPRRRNSATLRRSGSGAVGRCCSHTTAEVRSLTTPDDDDRPLGASPGVRSRRWMLGLIIKQVVERRGSFMPSFRLSPKGEIPGDAVVSCE